ncbi:hypothetical protein DFH27DRAFT_527159 [Peziza echinospora]|nr:hypothetical protein DFH27DRAFT_527159 [Peziza echinospora]
MAWNRMESHGIDDLSFPWHVIVGSHLASSAPRCPKSQQNNTALHLPARNPHNSQSETTQSLRTRHFLLTPINSNPRTTQPMPPPSSTPGTPMRPLKAILIDCSPAAANKVTGSIDEVVRTYRALPANTKTAQFIVRNNEFELRRKNAQVVRDKSDSNDRDMLCASACLREVVTVVFKALGLKSQVACLSTAVNRDCREFYLKWAKEQLGMLASHFGTLHNHYPAVQSLSAAEALGLFTSLTHEANNANKIAHYPSLKQIAWMVSFLTTNPQTFPTVNRQHLTQLLQYFLGGIDITAAGTDSLFPQWCATGSFANTFETALQANTAWKETALVGACDAGVNTGWQAKEFKRYIAHLKNEGKAVDYDEYCKVSTEKGITETERDELQSEVDILKVTMGQLADDHEKQNDKIVEQNAKIVQLNATTAEQNATIAEQNATIAEQNAKIVQQDATIAEQNAKIVQQDATIAEQNAKLVQQDATIAEQNAKIVQQDATIARQDATIATLQREVHQLHKTVDSLDKFIRAHLAQCSYSGGPPSLS